MWQINRNGEREFRHGMDDWTGAARAAANCPAFRLDVDEELVTDESISCYNCRYRRWTATSFTCMHEQRPADRQFNVTCALHNGCTAEEVPLPPAIQ